MSPLQGHGQWPLQVKPSRSLEGNTKRAPLKDAPGNSWIVTRGLRLGQDTVDLHTGSAKGLSYRRWSLPSAFIAMTLSRSIRVLPPR